MPDPRRILVHIGLPEVVPGAIERFLRLNRGPLEAAGLDLALPGDLAEPLRAARHLARHGRALALADLAEALEAALPPRLAGDGRDLVISCDGLAGPPPGLAAGGGPAGPGEAGGPAAPLAAVVGGWLAERFPGSDLRMVWVTRADWARRAWLSAVARGAAAGPAQAFAARVAAVDPGAAVVAAAEAVAEASGGRVEPFLLALEEAATHPLGPGGALLELLDWPEGRLAGLEPAAPERTPPPQVLDALREATQAGAPPREARAARVALLEAARLPAWARLAREG